MRAQSRRRVWVWLRLAGVLSVAAGMTAACGSSGGAGQGSGGPKASPYKFYLIGSQTGAGNNSGLGGLAGFETVFNQVNAAGGINGHPLRWTVVDDQSSVTVASADARQAVSAAPTAILDTGLSTYFNARMPIYTSAKIPVYTPNSTSGPLVPWLYSTNVTAVQNAGTAVTMAAALLHGSLQGKRVAFVGTQAPSVAAGVPIIQAQVAKAGGTVSKVQYRPASSLEFTSGAAQIVASKPDVVVIFDINAPLVAKALITAGYKGPIGAGFAGSTDSSFKQVSSPQYFALRFVKEASPGTEQYKAAQSYRFGDVARNAYFGQGWAAAQLLAAALKSCDFPCSHDALIKATDALGTFTVPGDVTFSPLQVSAQLHATLTSYQLYQWHVASAAPVPFGNLVKVAPPQG
jgi:branched-chain amino acid transport system substrate-binding protein